MWQGGKAIYFSAAGFHAVISILLLSGLFLSWLTISAN
jgi:hypothetical protein